MGIFWRKIVEGSGAHGGQGICPISQFLAEPGFALPQLKALRFLG